MLKRYLEYGLCGLVLLFILTACAPSSPKSAQNQRTLIGAGSGAVGGAITGGVIGGAEGAGVGAVVGSVLGAAIGYNIGNGQNISTSDKLQEAGVGVINLGQEGMLVLPADDFFFQDSSNLNGQYYSILNLVTEYLQKWDIETIKVAGYTNDCGDPLRSVALSRQQAQNIADYLKNQGVKAPIIYAIGYGCSFPIADNHRADGQELNRRIQITYYRLDLNR